MRRLTEYWEWRNTSELQIWPGGGTLGHCPVGALTARGQAGLGSSGAGCTELLLFMQLGSTPHLEETMEQQDEESLEPLQACVEVSEASLTPQPEP